jgi:hypothetical protein
MSTAATVASPGSGISAFVRRFYFSIVFAILTALSILAFWDNLVSDVTQPSNSDPRMIVHGIFSLAWVIFLTLQANLVGTGKLRLHRQIGTAGFIVAAGLTLSTAYLFVAVWKGWSAMAPQVQANRIFLPSFALWIGLGYLNRRRPDLHKRLVYTGTLFLLEPVLSRCYGPLVRQFLPPMAKAQMASVLYIYIVVTWSAFFLSLFAYDRIVLRHVHPVSAGSYAWLLAVYGFVFLT